jgi:hypothetical protein
MRAFHPRSSSHADTGLPKLVATAPAAWDFQFRRNPAASEMTYRIRSSTNLIDWTTRHTFTGTTALPVSFSPGVSLTADPATQLLRYRPVTGQGKEFYRLEMTLPEP